MTKIRRVYIDAEQFFHRVEKQFLKMEQERATRLVEKLRVRYERLEQVEKACGRTFPFVLSQTH